MDRDLETREIVRIIVMLAHNLGLEVVAEGAETEEQVNQLKQMDCELAQGYFFSRPADHQAILELLMSNYPVNTSPPVTATRRMRPDQA